MSEKQKPASGSKRDHFAKVKDPSLAIAGDTDDRIFGLEPVFEIARGATVLDIGCHDGRIAERLADAGASRIDGLDISETFIDLARDRFLEKGVIANFQIVDLSAGAASLKDARLQPTYDLVLYLGVHHHLKGQMSGEELLRLERAIFALASDHLAVRTPQVHFDPLLPRILDVGFEPVTGFMKGKIAPVRHFRRVRKGASSR